MSRAYFELYQWYAENWACLFFHELGALQGISLSISALNTQGSAYIVLEVNINVFGEEHPNFLLINLLSWALTKVFQHIINNNSLRSARLVKDNEVICKEKMC